MDLSHSHSFFSWGAPTPAHPSQSAPRPHPPARIRAVTSQAPSPRDQYQKVRTSLLFGVLALTAVTAVLTIQGTMPVMPDEPWAGNASAGVSLAATLAAWFWARPRMPRRRAITSTDDFWRVPGTLNAAHLLLFLLEGGAMLAIVGTILSGVGLPTAVLVLALLGMLIVSPTWIEERMA